ncbi:MAG: HAD family hydrolase [Bacteroidales bacterium]|nr:HAD family hydrolase [Bacteroidales bacterium]MBR1959491.1 HAD family hydrolase [Bacteroidales bacterium]
MELKGQFRCIFFDADDTLWENERYFRAAEAKFIELLADYTTPEGVQDMLWRKQEDNIPLFGYGSKTYMIGMTDAALELCGGSLTEEIYYGIKNIITELAFHELQIIEGVKETLEALQGKYELIVATKGDLPEQMAKFRKSGLAHYFHHCEVMENKDEKNWLEVAAKHNLHPEEILMIGNSVKSDIAPVVNIGGRAIHVPHEVVWVHEMMDMPQSDRIIEVKKITEILDYLL